jgi:hypothetical protein
LPNQQGRFVRIAPIAFRSPLFPAPNMIYEILLPEMPYNAVLHRTLCVISAVDDGSCHISTGSSTLSAPDSLSPSACSPGLKGSGSAN